MSITAAHPDDDRHALIYDFSWDEPPPTYGWGLSLDGGHIDLETELPSPTAMFVHDTGGDEPVPPVELTFDPPVTKVGFYGEAAIFYAVGWDGSITLEAFDVDRVSLGLVEVFADGAGMNNFVDPPVDLGPVDTWIGLMASEPIGSVEIVGLYFVMDDLIFEGGVVPIETQTWSEVKSLYR